MLIRTFQDNKSEDGLSSSDIKECRRNIALFVPRNEWESNHLSHGRAILTNISVSSGEKSFTVIKVPNSAVLKINVYYFNISFESGDLRSSIFNLTESYGTEHQVCYNENNTMDKDMGVFSSLLNNVDQSYKYFLNIKDTACLIPPTYYTENHMYSCEGDFYSVIDSDIMHVFPLSELMDDKTRLMVYDIGKWDTMNEAVRETIDKDIMRDNYTVATVSDSIFNIMSQTAINDAIFIYETGKEPNIKGGWIPNKQYLLPNDVFQNISLAKKSFVFACKEIEKKFGNVRVQMVPSMHGDRFNIKCRDYDVENQPFQNPKSPENVLSIDRSVPVTTSVSVAVHDIIEMDVDNAYKGYILKGKRE
jgi:hypothetical protein